MKIRTEQVIDVQDWDALVRETYGRSYNLQQQDGCKDRQRVTLAVPEEGYDYENITVPEIVNHDERGVSFASWLARDPKQKLDSKDSWEREHGLSMWWERNFYPNAQMIANDLHAKDLLPAGEYVIDIDW